MRSRSFSKYDSDSDLLLRSRITDLGTHLRIIVAPEEDNTKDGTLSQLTKSTLSTNYDKPVMFILDGGARTEWWTSGFSHCPWDAAVRIRTANRDISHYNDSDGVSHRLDGPAETTYIADPREERYEEHWRKDGKPHHEGGPSTTAVMRPNDSPKTWADVITSNEWSQHINKFPGSTPIKYSTTVDQFWCQHGVPYRAGDAPTSILETGVSEVMQLSSLIGVKKTKLCIRREFVWKDEDSMVSRSNGPAIVKLLGVYEVTKNGKLISQSYESIDVTWYYRGIIIPNQRITDWVAENNIVPGEAPYVTNSFFAEAEDETCFIMDIISGLEV